MNAKHNDILSNLELEHKITESVANEETMDLQSLRALIQKDPTNKKIKAIANKYGYEAEESHITSWGDPHIVVHPKNRDDFHPDVYFRADVYGKKAQVFEIQTTSYGSLNMKEYEEFIKCCNDAFNMVKELSKVDLSKLVAWPKGE